MRRFLTLLLAGALGVLGLVAAIDAFRESPPDPTAPARGPTTAPDLPGRDSLARLFRRHGVTGTLYASQRRCPSGRPRPLRAFRLPALHSVETPLWRGCHFSLSPDGIFVAAHDAAWQPDGLVVATGGGGTIEVTSPSPVWGYRFPGAAPTFRPDGTLTYVRRGRVVEWTRRCPRGSEIVTFLGNPATARCPRPLLDPRRPVERLAWLSDTRLATAGGGSIALYEGRRRLFAAQLDARDIDLRPSPGGRLLAVLTERETFVLRPGGALGWTAPLEAGALDWSPDGRWLALATARGVYVFRVADWTALFRIPLVTRDLAWRDA